MIKKIMLILAVFGFVEKICASDTPKRKLELNSDHRKRQRLVTSEDDDSDPESVSFAHSAQDRDGIDVLLQVASEASPLKGRARNPRSQRGLTDVLLEVRLREAQEEITRLKTMFKGFHEGGTIDQLEQLSEAHKQQLTRVQNRLQVEQEKVRALQIQVVTVEQKYIVAERELQEQRSAQDGLRAECSQLQLQVEQLGVQKKQAENALQIQQKLIEDVRIESSSIEEEFSSIRHQFEKVQQEKQILEQQLQQMVLLKTQADATSIDLLSKKLEEAKEDMTKLQTHSDTLHTVIAHQLKMIKELDGSKAHLAKESELNKESAKRFENLYHMSQEDMQSRQYENSLQSQIQKKELAQLKQDLANYKVAESVRRQLEKQACDSRVEQAKLQARDELIAHLAELEKLLSSKNSELEMTRMSLDFQRTTYQDNIAGTQKSLVQLEEKVSSLQEQVRSLQEQYDEVCNERDALGQTVQEKEGLIDAGRINRQKLERRIELLNSNLSQAKRDIAYLEQEKLSMLTKASIDKEQISRLEEENAQIKRDVDSMNRRVNELRSQLFSASAVQDNFNTATQQILYLKQNIQTLLARESAYREQVSSLQQELDSKIARESELQSQLLASAARMPDRNDSAQGQRWWAHHGYGV